MDDLLYISAKGKQVTIKMECYLIITRMLSKRYRLMQKYQSLEDAKEKGEISYMEETEEEQQRPAIRRRFRDLHFVPIAAVN